MSAIHVRVTPMDNAAIEALFAKHHVGSMAIAFHDRVTIALVNYVYANRWIYGRMEDGPDITTLRHHHWVAFEVNEIRGIYDWRTATANGSVEFLSANGPEREAAEARQALALLRTAVPAVFTPRDPLPQRVQLFRIYADTLAGREASSDAGSALPPA
jgi:nitroimidazol reductase NimA-like FMN-containing flavoprotein (pyridoxamine 5'-phosphate oxidase superfamily)